MECLSRGRRPAATQRRRKKEPGSRESSNDFTSRHASKKESVQALPVVWARAEVFYANLNFRAATLNQREWTQDERQWSCGYSVEKKRWSLWSSWTGTPGESVLHIASCFLPRNPGQPHHLRHQNRIWWWIKVNLPVVFAQATLHGPLHPADEDLSQLAREYLNLN